MNLYENLLSKNEYLSVIGLGYVGMPIAVAFAKKINVIGFDINRKKIDQYLNGIDPTKEVGDDIIRDTKVIFTNKEIDLQKAKFHIIAVPTPINSDKTPDLKPVIGASTILGKNLTKGSIVVYESTVYPGVTEEICIPILEKESGLKCGRDFKIGYSPERINPGDKNHTLSNIVKIVSGMDSETLEIIAQVYELVVQAGVYKAQSIKVAEAAKVIENSQRDINIAFMNELSIIFNKMGIDTKAVLQAASTKWNFLNFYPGLVGGHCIGVDPYYLTYKAEQLGYHSQVILAGRRINDDMGKYIASSTIKSLIKADISIKEAKIAVFGITFKENCPDIRNSKVADIIEELKEYGISPYVCDPNADEEETFKEYGVKLIQLDNVRNMDCIIIAVSHRQFAELSANDYKIFFNPDVCRKKVIVDVKGILSKDEVEQSGYMYWRL